MEKTQLDKLIKAIEARETSTNGWVHFAIVPAPNQDELRITVFIHDGTVTKKVTMGFML